MSIARIAASVCAGLVLAASHHRASAEGVITVEHAQLELQPVHSGGRMSACGVRVRAPHTLADHSVRTWDLTFYLAEPGQGFKGFALAVNAASYDVATAGAVQRMRPAPTELAFTVQGNTQLFTATDLQPSQPEGATLARLAGQGAGQILTALGAGTPVVIFFRPKDADTEAVIVSGELSRSMHDGFGACIQAMDAAAR